jgi:hypothetical protein
MPRAVRVLRIAPDPLRPDRLAELERLFATTVLATDTVTTDPAALLHAGRTLAADAIVLDVVAPTAIARLIDTLAAHHLLRPTWIEARTSRGENQPRFAGGALVERDGTLRTLADGELAPRDRSIEPDFKGSAPMPP